MITTGGDCSKLKQILRAYFNDLLRVFSDLNIFALKDFLNVRVPLIERCIEMFNCSQENFLISHKNPVCMNLGQISGLERCLTSSGQIIKINAFDHDIGLIGWLKTNLRHPFELACLSFFDDNAEVTITPVQKSLILETIIGQLGVHHDNNVIQTICWVFKRCE